MKAERIEQEHGTLITFEHTFFIPSGAHKEATIAHLVRYERSHRQAVEIFVEKNLAYGDNFIYGGVVGCVHELLGCMGRLFTLCLQDPFYGKGNKVDIINALTDMANYAHMTQILISLNRWEPKL
jgi:hypothetical protein